MVADETWQEILANNLAQLNTPGYKGETPVVGSFQRYLVSRAGAGGASIGSQSAGAAVMATVTDFSQGPLQKTGNPLDVALQGPGFFAVRTSQGIRYTRQGAFSLDSQGQLVTPQGYLVLDPGLQPLHAGASAAIGPDGTLSDGSGATGRIGIFNPATAQLTDTGGGFFAAQGGAPAIGAARVVPGSLEGSNVSAPEVLAAMIQVLRHFEAGQQVVKSDTATLDRFLQVAG